MANNAVKLSELAACTNPQATDLLVLTSDPAGNATSLSVTVETFRSNPIEVSAKTANTYTILASDTGKILSFSNTTNIAVTFENDLVAGHNVSLLQLNTGKIVVTNGAGTAINHPSSYFTTNGQFTTAFVSIFANADGNSANGVIRGELE